jgi:ABC-2 type transport system permease protein
MPIFDQGYQHWSGTLAGHSWRWLAIARHGVRVSLREGKPGRSLRLVLLLSWLPALMLATLLCLWGLAERGSSLIAFLSPMLEFLGLSALADPRQFRVEVWTICFSYFLDAELIASMILVVMVGPDLISQDLRYNALPLYFSRPLRRIDYFAGKLGVIVAFLGMVIIVPSLIAYVLGLLFSLDLTIIRDTFHILVASVVYGLVIALSAGLLMLALSSLTRNSRYISLMWFAVWIGSLAVSGILESANQQHRRHQARSMAQGNIDELLAAEREASRNNWRPLVSYTANLSRVGRQLVGTDAAWERLSELQPPGRRGLFLAQSGPQHPWYWSAAVLAALIGLSACILNFRIKSLDRLK